MNKQPKFDPMTQKPLKKNIIQENIQPANNINVEGKISDDSNPATKSTKGKKCEKEEVEDEEEEFNW